MCRFSKFAQKKYQTTPPFSVQSEHERQNFSKTANIMWKWTLNITVLYGTDNFPCDLGHPSCSNSVIPLYIGNNKRGTYIWRSYLLKQKLLKDEGGGRGCNFWIFDFFNSVPYIYMMKLVCQFLTVNSLSPLNSEPLKFFLEILNRFWNMNFSILEFLKGRLTVH